MQAASINDHEVIRLLLEYGANINARRRFYPTSLYAASVRGQRGMVRLLLDKGAGVNSGGRYYGNVLQAALANGQQAVVQLLLDEGAEFDKFGGHYCNIQQAASYRGQAVNQLILDRGVDINGRMPWRCCAGCIA